MESWQIWVALIATLAAVGSAIAALINASLNRKELRMRLRPWVGVARWTSSDTRRTSADGVTYQAGVVIKNFGNLPAFNVSIKCSIGTGSEKCEVVKRSGLLLWPGEDEDLGWNILPPLSEGAIILTEIDIKYKLTPNGKRQVQTRQTMQYYTGSMKFADAVDGLSYAE